MWTQDLFATSGARRPSDRSYWIGIVSGEHVQHALEGGFAQFCHGKVQPLTRMKAGDGFVYYSPNMTFRGKERFQCFTAIGLVKERPPYRFDMGGGFVPHRRDIDWADSTEAPIHAWLDSLEFAEGSRNWGYKLRFGHFAISEHDFRVIAQAMHADLDKLFPGTAAFPWQASA